MILGLVSIVLGFILMFSADVETTQYFTGWVFGAIALSAGPGLQGVSKITVGSVAVAFVVTHPQTLVPKPKEIPCKNGEVRTINGAPTCICFPPYTGEECDICAQGAIIESGSNENKNAVCKTCRHMYAFPHCKDLLPGYDTETTCKSNFQPSCYAEGVNLFGESTYGEFAPGIRRDFINMDEDECKDTDTTWNPNTFSYNKAIVYCDKCRGNRAGRYCCEDGKTGPDCNKIVPKCTDMLDLGATLVPNSFPVAYTLVAPEKCYPLDDNACSCGGDFIGDLMCASNFCDGGLCASVARTPPYEERCNCEYGVGPDCEVPPCYGGTRMFNGAAICACDSKHSDTHIACGIEEDLKQCHAGLYGDQCIECQCAKQVEPVIGECPKNIYGEFHNDLATGELTQCVQSGICTNEPDDCGGNAEVPARCKTWNNMMTFEILLFGGYKCQNVEADACLIGEPCT